MQLLEAKIESPHHLLLVWDEEIPFAEVHIPGYTIVKIKHAKDYHSHYVEVNEAFNLHHPVHVLWQNQSFIATTGNIVRSEWFETHYRYEGPLGNDYYKERTTFRLWAPLAQSVELVLSLSPKTKGQNFTMQYIEKGVYAVTVEGDCKDMYYQYHIQFPNGMVHQTKDPYALMDVDGYSQVIDSHRQSYPIREDVRHHILYPINIDHFIGASSGLPIVLQKTFQGLSTKGTLNQFGDMTGLDYLEWLNPTHVVLEKAIENYHGSILNAHMPNPNWILSQDADQKIDEVRGTIEQLHRSQMNVLVALDLSHVYQPEIHPLHLTVPGYYFRYDEDGMIVDRLHKGCELASERYMTRRYICHIIQTWLDLYQVDGVYLQNMTTFDEETVLAIESLTKLDDTPAVIIASGNDVVIPEAIERRQASLYPNIHWSNPAFASSLLHIAEALPHSEAEVSNQILGGLSETMTFLSPLQVVQNLETVTNLPMMAIALLLVSQGHILLPSSAEEIDWNFGKMHDLQAQEVKKWLQYRHDEALFNFETYDDIHHQTQLLYCKDQTIAIALSNDVKTDILVANVGETPTYIDLPTGTYYMRSHNYHIEMYPNPLKIKDQLVIEPNQLLILERH